MPLHYVRRLTVVSLLVCTNTYGNGSDMYYNTMAGIMYVVRHVVGYCIPILILISSTNNPRNYSL